MHPGSLLETVASNIAGCFALSSKYRALLNPCHITPRISGASFAASACMRLLGLTFDLYGQGCPQVSATILLLPLFLELAARIEGDHLRSLAKVSGP